MAGTAKHMNQILGTPVPDWQAPQPPAAEPMQGRFCRLEPLDPERHAADLYAAHALDIEGKNWRYLPYGPFVGLDAYRAWMIQTCLGRDPLFFAIIDTATGYAVGVCSYLRIDPRMGTIEVGHLNYSPLLQKQPAATEAMVLMMARAFALGYRRYEWKCNALNWPSRVAAQRLGLSYEGLFRQAAVIKGYNRDTAWYAAIDQEWPSLQRAFQRWLNPANFDWQGQQRERLSDLTKAVLVQQG